MYMYVYVYIQIYIYVCMYVYIHISYQITCMKQLEDNENISIENQHQLGWPLGTRLNRLTPLAALATYSMDLKTKLCGILLD